MTSSSSTHTCPQCKEPAEAPRGETESIRHCPNCKLPLVVVAGKYEIKHLLNEGGCGVLYLAHHQRLQMDPLRVIKFIKPEYCTNTKTIKRLQREVEVTAALSQKNEHIVRVFDDFGEVHSLGNYYVMEYLEGEDLADRMSYTKHLSYKKIGHVFSQMCKAIGDAHKAGVVHRDLKPQNIFLTRRGDDDLFVKVIDFGIAKNIDSSNQTKLTQGALGTPEYMSPEQVQGQEISTQTDVYALGIILYELIVGHTPFLPPTETNPVPTQIALAHIMKEPPPPSTMTRRALPEGLEALIMKCLEKSASSRYASAGELLKAFKEIDLTTAHSKQALKGTFLDSEESLLKPWQSESEPLPSAEWEPRSSSSSQSPNPVPIPAAPRSVHTSAASPLHSSSMPSMHTGTQEPSASSRSITFVLLGSILLVTVLVSTFIWSKWGNKKNQTIQLPKKQRTHIVHARPLPSTQKRTVSRTVSKTHNPIVRTNPSVRIKRAKRVVQRPIHRRRFIQKRSRRRRRRTVRRKAVARTVSKVKKSTIGCPPDRSNHKWIRLDVFPPYAHLSNILSRHTKRFKTHYCSLLRKGGKLRGIIKADGFLTCAIVGWTPHSNRVRIRLKLRKEQDTLGNLISSSFNYCVR